MAEERPRDTIGRFRMLAAWGGMALLLSGCSMMDGIPFIGGSRVQLDCPVIKVLGDAGEIIQYRPGPGRDITDIQIEAEIIAFSGSCQYEEEDGIYQSVNVELESITFEVTRGPAYRGRTAKVRYFVKIPRFYPSPLGASEFTARVAFPENRNTVEFSDGGIDIDIPLGKGVRGPNQVIYLGFVLSREQMELNRQRKRMRVLGGG